MPNRKCLQCNNLSTELTFKFTCGHIHCGICVSRLLLLSSFQPVLKFNTPIRLKCDCKNGYYEDSLDKLQRILFETHQREKRKEVSQCNVHSQTAISFCKECKKWVCDICLSTFHKSHFPTHTLLPNEPSDENQCLSNAHCLKKELFCISCQDSICPRCVVQGEAHYQHKTIPYQAYIKQIKAKTDFSFKTFENFSNVIDTVEASFKTAFSNKYQENNRQIDAIAAKLHEIKLNYTQKIDEYNRYLELVFKVIKSAYYNFYCELTTPEPNFISLSFLNRINTEFDDLVASYPYQSNMEAIIANLNKINSKEFVDFSMKFKYHKLAFLKELKDNEAQVYSLCELSDKTIASGYSDQSIKIWELNRGECLARLLGHKGTVFSLLQLKDKRLVSGSGDTNILIWSIEEQKQLHLLKGHTNDIYSLCELSNGSLASSSKDGSVIIWNLNDFTPLKKLPAPHKSLGYILEWKENVLLVASVDSKILKWNVDKDEEQIDRLIGHTNTIFSMIKLPNDRIASGSCDKSIKLWDMPSMKCLHTFLGHTGFIWSMALSGEAKLISSSSDFSFKIWDLVLLKCITTIDAHAQDVTAVIALRETNQIATGSSDSYIKLWEY